METYRIVFSGSGGQGVITAAIILAEAAAIHNDLYAVQSQSYGPEARGGATRSDVIISKRSIDYPKVSNPDLLVALTQEAYTKFSDLVIPGGLVITDSRFVTPKRNSDSIQKEFAIFDNVVETLKNPVVLNSCMLGIVIELTKIVKPESII